MNSRKDKINGAIFVMSYNCAPQLERVISSFKNNSNKLIQIGWNNIYFVNNKSKDRTLDVMKENLRSLNNLNLNCKIINNHNNYGLGGSHKVSFYTAEKFGYSHICIFHGDDQAKIEDLIRIPNDFYVSECILGSRFSKDSKLIGYSTLRFLGNKFFNILFSIVLRKKILDLGSGLNIFSKKFFHDKKITLFPDGMYFNQSLLIHITRFYSFKYFPITWSEKDQITNVRNFQMGIDTIKNLISEKLKIGIRNRSIYKNSFEYTYDLIE